MFARRRISSNVLDKENQVFKNVKQPIPTRTAFRDISNKVFPSRANEVRKSEALKQQRIIVKQSEQQKREPLGEIIPKHTNLLRKSVQDDLFEPKFKSLTRSKSESALSISETGVPPPSPQMDKKDKDDPQACVEYVKDIFEFYKKNERKYMPDPNYMSRQPDISFSMRGILMDWLVDVHRKFRLNHETIYLTANVIDRFLCEKAVSRGKLQLVGVTGLLIASKYQDIYYPNIENLVDVSAKAYTKDDILRMERLMLATLKFSVTVTTPLPFLKRYIKAAEAENDIEMQSLAYYFSDMSIPDHRFLKFQPSLIASAAIYMARKCMRCLQPWTSKLEHYTGYKEHDLTDVCNLMIETVKNENRTKLNAVRKKYLSSKQFRVAEIATRYVSNL